MLALGGFFLMKAYQSGGEASRILPVFGLSYVFSSLGGIFILNEKSDIAKKIIALLLVLSGTYILQIQ